MSTIYYPSGCDTGIPAHYCNPCDEIEHGRVRSVALVANSLTIVDPTDPTEWQAGIDSGEIRIIPEVQGSFDGGAPVEEAGFGNQATRVTGYNFTLNFKDPNYKENATFYNAIKNSRNWRIAYRTETQIHMTDVAAQFTPKNPVGENLTDVVLWDVEVKWQDGDLPVPYDTPEGIFDCFSLTPIA